MYQFWNPKIMLVRIKKNLFMRFQLCITLNNVKKEEVTIYSSWKPLRN